MRVSTHQKQSFRPRCVSPHIESKLKVHSFYASVRISTHQKQAFIYSTTPSFNSIKSFTPRCVSPRIENNISCLGACLHASKTSLKYIHFTPQCESPRIKNKLLFTLLHLIQLYQILCFSTRFCLRYFFAKSFAFTYHHIIYPQLYFIIVPVLYFILRQHSIL
jgi:hypothetical protein